MTQMSPEEEALYALDQNLPRDDLSLAAQLEYDRLRPAWERGEPRPAWDREAARLAWERTHDRKRQGSRHVTTPSRNVTIANWQGRILTACFVVLLGAVAVLWGFSSLRSPALRVTFLAIAAFALTWSLYRGWRMEVRFDDHHVTIRKFLRTYRIGWPEISRFEDGRITVNVGNARAWALDIVLRDGRVITTRLGPLSSGFPWKGTPETLSAIRQVAELHKIPAELTGQPRGPRTSIRGG
jgi:hypothetical protein